jgi:hypothetical protein
MQYSIFLFGGILLIVGLYMYDKGVAVYEETGYDARGLEIAGFITVGLGVIFLVLSYIYARSGAKVIGKNCPYCYGTGYVDAGPKKAARKDVCPVCGGSGILEDKGLKLLEEEQNRQAKEKEKETTEAIEA